MSASTASSHNQSRVKPYQLYIYTVSAIGMLIFLLSVFSILQITTPLLFLLLVGLSVLAAFNTTSVQVSKTGITYAVGGAVSFASIPMFGIGGGVVLVLIYALSLWLIKPAEGETWKRNVSQLVFNVGMQLIAIVCAGVLLLYLQSFFG